jgi:hypothetical protein
MSDLLIGSLSILGIVIGLAAVFWAIAKFPRGPER